MMETIETLLQQGNYKKLHELIDSLLKVERNLTLLNFKAELYFREGKPKKALGVIEGVLKEYPKDEAGNALKAYLLMSGKRFEEALGCCDMVLKSQPKNFNMIILKANLLYQLGNSQYRRWVKKAEKIDKGRAQEFMNSYWGLIDEARRQGKDKDKG